MIQHECAIALSVGVSIAVFFITITIASTVFKAQFTDAACSSLERLDAMNRQSEIWLLVESGSALRWNFWRYPVGSWAFIAALSAVALRVPLRLFNT